MKACLRVFAVVFALFLFFGNDASVVAAPLSKLGIFVIGPNSTGEVSTIIDACPAVLKVQDPHSYEVIRTGMKTYHEKCPEGTVILRIFVSQEQEKYTVSDDPAASAQRFWNRLSGPIQELKNQGAFQYVDYVSGPNEYDNMPALQSGDTAVAQWTADFWVELATLMNAAGAKPMLGEFPVGNLEPEHYPFLAEALKKIKSKNIDVAFSYHSYGESYTFNAASEQWYSLRYRKFREYLESNYSGLLDIPFYITEVGVGLSETGYDTGAHQEELKVWLAAFDEEIKKPSDHYVKGAALFQIGGWGDWFHRAIEGIAGWLAGYVNGQAEVPVIVSPDSGHDECEDQGLLANLSSFFRSWWDKLTKSAVPDGVALVTDSKLPPRNREKCVSQMKTGQAVAGVESTEQNVLQAQDAFTSRVADASQDYSMLAALAQPTIVPLSRRGWAFDLFGGDAGDIFGAGLSGAGQFLDGQLPPVVPLDKPELPNDPGEVTPPPDPGGTLPTIGGWSAGTLVDRIRQQCLNGVVQRGSYACVDNLATKYTPGASQAGIDILKQSAADYKYLQCVGFATASVKITTDIDVPGRASAVNYSWDVPSGWVFTPFNQSNQEKLKNGTLRLAGGDLVVWGYYTHGHIANVCGIVDAAAYKYTICEANWGGNGLVHKRDIELFHEINLPLYNEKIDNGLLGFLRKT